ncbi:hypothetical protein J6590_024015 [Homalodisca vitripennis]|nr:hypothetical protein J6590_024015 [Homalodisca vitripennis]
MDNLSLEETQELVLSIQYFKAKRCATRMRIWCQIRTGQGACVCLPADLGGSGLEQYIRGRGSNNCDERGGAGSCYKYRSRWWRTLTPTQSNVWQWDRVEQDHHDQDRTPRVASERVDDRLSLDRCKRPRGFTLQSCSLKSTILINQEKGEKGESRAGIIYQIAGGRKERGGLARRHALLHLLSKSLKSISSKMMNRSVDLDLI